MNTKHYVLLSIISTIAVVGLTVGSVVSAQTVTPLSCNVAASTVYQNQSAIFSAQGGNGVAVEQVARLRDPADLIGELLEEVTPPCDEDTLPAGGRERARRRGADAGRRTGDDCDPAAHPRRLGIRRSTDRTRPGATPWMTIASRYGNHGTTTSARL